MGPQLHHRRDACFEGMEVCPVCGYEEVPWCGLCCRGQSHLLQREQCYVAGRCEEVLRRPIKWAEGSLQNGLRHYHITIFIITHFLPVETIVNARKTCLRVIDFHPSFILNMNPLRIQ